MQARPRIGQDVAAGILFAAFGIAGLYVGGDYRTGEALRMGPGYFPRVLSWLLIAIGAVIAARGALSGDSAIERWYLRPLVFVLGGLMAFRYLIEPAGLVPATLATVLLGAMGSREFRLHEALLLGAGLALATVGLFVYALGLPMKIWPF